MTSDAPLPNLDTFCRAAEVCNFTAAARLLHLTQAAVSQRIHALEQTLGTPLFQRQGGRVLLTEAGRTLYGYAQRILDLHDEARRALGSHAAPLVGELTLAASSVPGEHLLPALLSVFGQKFPQVQVRVGVSDSLTVLRQVERGEVSLGLVGRRIDNPHLDFRFLARDRLVVIVPPGHPLDGAGSVTAEQLAREPLILREAGSGSRHGFETALEHGGRSLGDFRIALELGSNEAIKEAVLRGVGLAVLSTYAVRKDLAAGHLRAIIIPDIPCEREMFVVRDRRRVLAAPARQFLAFLDTCPLPSP